MSEFDPNEGKKTAFDISKYGAKFIANNKEAIIDKGRKLSALLKHPGKFLTNPMNFGTTAAIGCVLLVVIMLLTTSTSTLGATENMYTKSSDFMTDTLKPEYNKAKKEAEGTIKQYANRPLDEGGFNCGDTYLWGLVETGVSAEEIDDNHTTLSANGERIEVDGDGVEPSEEERKKHKNACTIDIEYYPPLEDDAGLMSAYITALNGFFQNIPPVAYETGHIDEDDPFIAQLNGDPGEPVDADGEEEDGEYLDSDEDDDAYWESYESKVEKNATKYDSMNSKEFQDDFKAFVNKSTATYKYLDEVKTEDYSSNMIPIFFVVYSDKMWEQDTVDVEVTPKWESEEDTSVSYYTDDNGAEHEVAASKVSDGQYCEVTKSTQSSSTTGGAVTQTSKCYDVEHPVKWYVTYEYKFKMRLPILYDLSQYRSRELENFHKAMIENGIDEEVVNEYIGDTINMTYRQEINIHDLGEAEEYLKSETDRILSLMDYEIKPVAERDVYGGYSYFFGSNYLRLTGTPGWDGRAPDATWSGWDALWGHYADGNIGAAESAYRKHCDEIHRISPSWIGVSYGNYWCTEFAFLWVYDHYGYDYAKQLVGAGEGKDMAANLILNHSAYYQAGSTPAAGAIVSVSGGESPNHVLVIEKVEGDKIWVSDGHVKTYGIRVGIEWNRADFERHYGGPEHVTYANPVQH